MTLVRFAISVVISLIGVCGFGVFVYFKNYAAALLAISTGIINGVSSHLNFLHYKNKLQEWYSPQHLRQISYFGFYSFAISTSVLVYFSVIEIMERKPILPIEESAVIPVIWAFLTLNSGVLLLYFTRSYNNGGEQHSLLVEEPPQEESDQQTEIIDAQD